jgi:UPF0755 protein
MLEEHPSTEKSSFAAPLEAPNPPPGKRRVPLLVWALLFAFLVALFISWRLIASPSEFQPDTTINVRAGWNVVDIGRELEAKQVIASAKMFRVIVSFAGGDRGIPAGVYRFPHAENIFHVVGHFINERGETTAKITFPEGSSNKQIAAIGAKNLPQFDPSSFMELAKNDEGYLFPDTYFFYDTATSGEVYLEMKENFEEKTKSLRAEADITKRSWSDVIILASLIEEEAMTAEDRRLIAGILLHRIQLGMYLGVDATFAYTLGKASSEITGDDLRSDDPYNTYRNKGLPPRAITNPGLDAITAALHPVVSPYLYYLSDKQQKMHYAKTFDEHKANKAKYLSN